MLEPRRLAARTIAQRMAALWGDGVGQTIGFRVRFESRVGQSTKLEVVTEGILTRMLQRDNALEEAGLVIFDEFHERSLHADLALALCREAQQVLRPDLRILIMSATLNMPQLSQLLNSPVVESKGRQYPVEIIYTEDADDQFLPELTARMIVRAKNEHEGDILAFLPGEAEIRKCEALLDSLKPDFSIHPLYGQLSPQEQFAAIMPDKQGLRKVVLATSIAETSLTIEGIKVVVDCGFGRVSRFDIRSGLSRLETIRISKDSADQRAGRAGRLSSGVCYRMWSKATHERLAAQRTPEILEADLCGVVLELKLWGVNDIRQLTWLTPPPKASLSQALETLEQLGAIENGKIKEHGKQIHDLSCHPRLAHMLIMAREIKQTTLAADLAALLEERDPLPKDTGVDINLRIEALRRARKNGGGGRFARIEKAASNYRKMLACELSNDPVDPYETGLLLAYAYPERIASARPGNNAQFQLANGRYAMIGHKDALAHEPWLAVAHMDMRDGLGKIFLASQLNPRDLLPMVKEREIITWDSRKGGLVASRDLRIGNIILQSKPLAKPDDEKIAEVISAAICQEGESLLDFGNEAMQQLQFRIQSLQKWSTGESWPDVSTPALLARNEHWLKPYLQGVRKNEDLKKLDISSALLHSLSWEQQQLLEKLAPAKIEVPSGSIIPLQYFANGAMPVLAVRLQEVFGLADTPRINNGKTAVVLHLLSPGYKPVQVTSDLKSFWDNLYHEVKKELQRRYPKHAWPDDPWNAQAVAKGRSVKK